MKKLQYIEDYILLMGNDMLTWPPPTSVIKLARYDEPIVNSMAEQIQRGLGFTDKQALLAHKIVCKYRKQWAAAGYDVSDQIENGVFNLPIRTIDRSRSISITNNRLELKFPYDQNLISHLRASVSAVPGSLFFDRESRAWVAALIEQRIVWAHQFGLENGFEFADGFLQALAIINRSEHYAIELVDSEQGLKITNAENSLNDYISHHGGFDRGNLLRLIDLSSLLGYRVSTELFLNTGHNLTEFQIHMLMNRDHNSVYHNEPDLAPAIEYARLTDRFPIYVYESASASMRRQIYQHFSPEEICEPKNLTAVSQDCRVVYVNNWKMSPVTIPLLITSHVLMIGHRRQQMLQSAEKIIYYTQEIAE